MNKYFDRKEKKILENKNPKGSYFLYDNIFGRLILKLVNKRFLSHLVGKYMDSRASKKLIKKFINNNNIKMDEFEKFEYRSFNEFFSRKIKSDNRKFSTNESDFCSPADAKVLVYSADKNLKFNIKDKEYSLETILRDKEIAKKYANGQILVFRLGVEDYHRYSYIDSGEVLNRKRIKGIYNTVAPIAFNRYKVFEENIREYEILNTKNFGEIIQMEVGAMFVGKIVNYHRARFTKGEEKGYFLFGGSTVVIFVKENTVIIDSDILKNSKEGLETKVLLGEKIGVKGKK